MIAATNRDLRAEANRGTFRSDLYYRLNVIKLELPPLRERRDDIALLIEHFYEQSRPGQRPPQRLLESFSRQPWPGNVRELRSAVERWILLDDIGEASWHEQSLPSESELPSAPPPASGAEVSFDPAVSFRAAKEQATAAWERAYLQKLMEHTTGNLSHAARVAGSDRSHLRDLLRKHGLRVPT